MRSYNGNGRDKYLTTGNERDIETELDYRWKRLSDPETGRFLQVDPMDDAFPDKSPYAYVDDKPTMLTDPNGDCPWCIVFALMLVSEPANAPTNESEVDRKAMNQARENHDLALVMALSTPAVSTYVRFAVKDEVKNFKDNVKTLKDDKTPEIKITDVGKTKTGDKRVKAQQGDKRLDITKDRVKEYKPEPNNPNNKEGKVNFHKDGLPEGSTVVPNSKGYKRTPTPAELKLLNPPM